MNEKPIQEQLKSAFQKTSKSDWIKVAELEVKKDNPLDALAWGANHGLTFQPLYDKNDVNELQYLNAFSLQPSQDYLSSARTWLNLPKVDVVDELKANQIALDHLAKGADGVLFDLKDGNPDFHKLLSLIDWPFCSVCFSLSSDSSILSLKNYITSKGYVSAEISGTLFWEKLPNDCEAVVRQFVEEKKLNSLGLFISPSLPVQEISDALAAGVQLIDTLTEKGIEVDVALQNISFSISMGTNFFLELAKVKALRMLWFQVAQAYGIKHYQLSDLHIHARSEPWVNENFKPHGNMLKGTTSSMAAIMGGCDSLTVSAEEQDNAMMTRMARNISNILREESHLNVVADPVSGSYTIETLVDNIAQKAWRTFVSGLNS